ncbi:uncharacterized mitochondrial protein AtMg00810-like [Humulus lupulus]|uniref:uncharacterized mitochondrial protein AtMg00810-like n=1 Tax=Humulus lupulus TaxID=3486 RepID=UPI002B406932|nr:uncharacterized mitochondrial protein AtMg00810-like [Humulus lupulus]
MTAMLDTKSAPTPGSMGKPLSKNDGTALATPLNIEEFLALFNVTMTCLDISFAVNRACQFMQHPTSATCLQKWILRYLRGTQAHGITLTTASNLHLGAFIDADWASNPDDRRSIGGYCVFLGDNIVSWSSTE